MKTRLLFVLTALLTPALADNDRDSHRERDDDRRRGPRVIIYQHAGFGGDSLVLYPGDVIDNFSGKTFANGSKLNDSVSSIRIEGNAEVFAYENSRFRGEALRLTENTRDLTGRFVTGSAGQNWNDRISSLRVERTRGRDRDWDRDHDDRPGGGRPPANPERLVKETFQAVLGRDPSASELREFRGRVVDAGWTERMLRDHLRTEDRYRTELAENIVRRAYRDVLEREVDTAGLKGYARLVRDQGWTESDVRDDLRKSAEYRNKPRP